MCIFPIEKRVESSSLGFEYDSYYVENSSQPKNLHNSSLWLSGPEPLVNYMNKEYFNIQKSSISSGNQIIFQKRGSSGFAHQMLGACDSLLLAVTNSRPFQSIASVFVFL